MNFSWNFFLTNNTITGGKDMKKLLAVLLALVLCFACVPGAFAEEAALADDNSLMDPAVIVAKSEEAAKKASTLSDMVEISENGYAVITGEGLGVAYVLPSDLVYVLTQDYLHQADVYARFYEDPLSIASGFIQNGMHLNVYDPINDVDLYVYITPSDWAALYPNTDNLSDNDVEFLQAYFNRNGGSGARNTVYGGAGGNKWFFFDFSNTNGLVYLMGSVSGYQIKVEYSAKTDAQVSRGLELLEGLTITAI